MRWNKRSKSSLYFPTFGEDGESMVHTQMSRLMDICTRCVAIQTRQGSIFPHIDNWATLGFLQIKNLPIQEKVFTQNSVRH